MCTAMTYKTKDHYFGRNMDFEFSYQETVTVTPRNFPFHFRKMPSITKHYAMIGMAYVVADYPLYYEATNEKGLSMAGLNFPGNTDYKPEADGKDNVTPFEFIPWILSQCADIAETKSLLERINLVKINFSEELPLSPLHWIISDKECSITVECVKEGLKIYENPVGILTNNPPFDYHMLHLSDYMMLSKEAPQNNFAKGVDMQIYSRGMGAMGLPGDYSSASRFIKAAFVKMNALSAEDEVSSVNQFFHMLDAVAQLRGCVHMGKEMYEITIYSSCCNTDKGIYYYTTYENREIVGVDMHKENLEAAELASYPLKKCNGFCIDN